MNESVFDNGLKFFNNLILKELNEFTNNGCYIGGGAIRNYFTGIPLKDYSDIDIWVKNKDAKIKAIEFFNKKNAVLTYSTNHAQMFKLNNKFYDLHYQFYVEPFEAMKYIDMTVSCGMCDGNKFYYPHNYFLHLATRSIIWNSFNGYNIELLTQRVQKMVLKGYKLSWEESKRINTEMTRYLININKEAGRDAATAH